MKQTQTQNQSLTSASASAVSGERAASIIDGYQPAPDGWDELLSAPGVVREHWAPLIGRLDRLGAAELARRWEHARRLIRENGVTYNVYGDERGLDRPWQLDAVPEIIPAAEWAVLARGLAQRARLLNAILADAYGEQRLLREGLLAPGALLAHPGFLRPCNRLAVPGGRWLHFYGADLVRGGDGRWRVTADRAQAPSGAGYALENRIVVSRALSEIYRDSHVQRLASFFLVMRQSLAALAPRSRGNPHIVLLTPGPYNETYFEHAYLARYLGYTLVEGGDLTVRDDRVFLKTLGGLQQVDVILRRLDDDFCDPLELRNDSTLGVAGLLAAARSGNVAIVNALGAALIENAALMPALPRLCRHLLHEELLLDSVETWWGASDFSYITEHLDELVVKPAYAGPIPASARSGKPGEDQRAALLADLTVRPHAYVAQRPLRLSTTPVWSDGRLQSRSMSLRAFAVVDSKGDGYSVMPGGLCRISTDAQPWEVSFQRGGGSKDTWVLADGPVAPVTLLASASARIEFQRGSVDLPSRVADNLFWLGRYGERAEDLTRILRAALMRLADAQDNGSNPGLAALVLVLKHTGALPEPASEPAELERQLIALVRDRDLPGSLIATVQNLHYAAFATRDRLSNDTWRIINRLEQNLDGETAGGESMRAGDVVPQLDRMIIGLAALAGMGMENTTRGPGWRFLDLGRRLERSMFTTDLLRAALAGQIDEPGLEAVLEVADSAITYRTRYLTSMQAPPVVDLLLTDATNPRSAAFQLELVTDHVANLPHVKERSLPSAEERLALGAHTWLRLVDPRDLCKLDENGERPQLAHFLDHLSSDLTVLSDTITTHYLSHATASRNLPTVGSVEA